MLKHNSDYKEYDSASNSFESAIDSARKGDDSLITQAFNALHKPKTKSTEYFKYKNPTAKAGTSLVFASKTLK